MKITSVAPLPYAGDDFHYRQRRELSARRIAYRQQLGRLADGAGRERGDVLTATARAKQRLDDVEAALHRLDTGTYGACRSCRRPIEVPRLEAIPEATRCVPCARGATPPAGGRA
jgi:RNA polymerase-binding transcription factor DksA